MSCENTHSNKHPTLKRQKSHPNCQSFYKVTKQKSYKDLIKVSNDLIQQPQALHSHVVAVQLDVEIIEVWDRGKQDANLCVGLIVQILKEKEKTQ